LKTRANNRRPGLRSRVCRGEAGFTLVEVLIAMAIISVTAVVLLDQRMGIVQGAGRARDVRTVWVLASQKMAELELDKTLWTGLGGQNNGDFSQVGPEYELFQWQYQIAREVIDTTNPTDPKKEGEPTRRELFRLSLVVQAPSLDEPILLEAEFSVEPPKQPGEDPAAAPPATGDPGKPTAPSSPGSGGLQK